MDYCKFENTCNALAQCVEHLQADRRFPSSWEAAAFHRLKALCDEYLKQSEITNSKEQ